MKNLPRHFRTRIFNPAILVAAFFGLIVQSALSQEIRAFWADGFSEGFKSPEQVDTLIRRLQTANCNAIFAQMRKSGDAYYLSRYDPWAHDNPQHFDALAYLIEKAHACKPRIQVHAWLNTCAVGKTYDNPFHIVKAHPDWKSLSDTGEDYDGEATKIDPGHPDAADWTFRVYLDVVRHYDVDGIHFDFVRYGSPDARGRWGYNPVSVARFNARYGRTGQPKWEDPLWKQWRRDQVTALVRKVYVMTQAVKPNVAVSAATITWLDGPHGERGMSARKFWDEKSPAMNRVFQDWRSWMKEGILDLNCQMSYYREAKHPDYFRHWVEWGKQNQFNRWVVPSSGVWLNPIPDSLRQIEVIRSPGRKGKKPAGVLLYSYSGTDAGPDGKERQSEEFFSALAQPSSYGKPPFEKPAEFPEMPWKSKRKTGVLKGFVLSSDSLYPVDGAKVSISGRTRRTQLTDGTGFFGFVDLPPGSYRVKVESRGFTTSQKKAKAQVLGRPDSSESSSHAISFLLGQSSTPQFQSMRDIGQLPAGSPVQLGPVTVYGGSDLFTSGIFVGQGAGQSEGSAGSVRVRTQSPLVLPLQAGDVVYVAGQIAFDSGERVIDRATVRLVDIDLPWVPGNETDARDLAANSGGIWPITRVTGNVTDVNDAGFGLNSEGVQVNVILNDRKNPGVEGSLAPLKPPGTGERGSVTGIVTITRSPDGQTLIRLRPRQENDLQFRPATISERLAGLVRWSWLPFCAVIVPVWRRRARRAKGSPSPQPSP